MDADNQGAEILPAGTGRGKAADDDLLLKDRLDLEPSATPHPRLIGTVAQLGDDPFQAFLLRRLEEGLALARDVVRVLEQG